MDIPVLFEDTDCLVIDKPPGVVVNRAESVKTETLQDWAEKYLHIEVAPNQAWGDDFVSRAGIAHRIDKETSGIVVIAKNPVAFAELQRQFKERVVKKTYLALVHGDVKPEEGEINVPVGRLPWNREHFGIVPGGKESITFYKKLSTVTHGVTGETLSLVELHPHTGRTHQIRVHMKYINHPLVGDFAYAGRKTSRTDRTWVTRIMLHAWKIVFLQPTTGAELAIESPMPDDMDRIIK
jgi:23S rRNA pseudouridine1911/1915/1917 synthase